MKKLEMILGGLDCAHCAGVIEEKIGNRDEVESARLNFINKKLSVTLNQEYSSKDLVDELIKQIDNIEPGLNIQVITQDSVRKDNLTEKNESGSNDLKYILVSFAFYLFGIVAKYKGLPEVTYLITIFVAYGISGRNVITKAIKNIPNGKVMDENLLMLVATIGAIAIGEYPEAVGVMLFYSVGEFLESKAVNKSRKNIEELMDIKVDIANVVKENKIIQTKPEEVKIGDKIMVKVGERVPVDGIIIKGDSRFDTSAITGESKLRGIVKGEEVLAGIINKKAVVIIEVTKLYEDSTISKILDLVENATSKKSKTENFITSFAKYYTPIVVSLAIAITLIPSLIFGKPFNEWLYRGLVFLVVSCPCALVLSIPLGYFSGIGISSKNGILIKGSNYLEVLKNVEHIVFDKTGTLTRGKFTVSKVHTTDGVTEEDVVNYGYIAESRSNHPISNSIKNYFKENNLKELILEENLLSSYEEIPAMGIFMKYDGDNILAGNSRLMTSNNIEFSNIDSSSTKVYVAVNGKYLGCIEIEDEIKYGTKEVLKKLKQNGIKSVKMFTGDVDSVAKDYCEKLEMDGYYSNLLPQDKVCLVEEIMRNKKENTKIAFVGDGINDAPVLARADVGISMGGIGSDAAIEASDVVLMTDEIIKINTAISIAKLTSKIVWQNVIFAIGIKVIVMILSTFGLANMWLAIFADVGVTLLAVLNSLRILSYKE